MYVPGLDPEAGDRAHFMVKIPCAQGIGREFSPIRPFSAKSVSKTLANSGLSRKIPYAVEQGIFSRQ
jgi:hypothetical protein